MQNLIAQRSLQGMSWAPKGHRWWTWAAPVLNPFLITKQGRDQSCLHHFFVQPPMEVNSKEVEAKKSTDIVVFTWKCAHYEAFRFQKFGTFRKKTSLLHSRELALLAFAFSFLSLTKKIDLLQTSHRICSQHLNYKNQSLLTGIIDIFWFKN